MIKSLALLAAACAASLVEAAGKPQTYKVYLGLEDDKTGALVNVFVPNQLKVRVGDTVSFQVTTKEIHSVNYLPGAKPVYPGLVVPVGANDTGYTPGRLMINPIVSTPTTGPFDGTKWLSSGVLSTDLGATSFNVTVSKPGTFTLVCVVHDAEMQKIQLTVVPRRSKIKTKNPAQVWAKAQTDAAALLKAANALIPSIANDTKPAVKNSDGTTTYYVKLGGYGTISAGTVHVDFSRFYPSSLKVKKGDTVVFYQPSNNMAVPHVASVANGVTIQPFAVPVVQKNKAVYLEMNPQSQFPWNGGKITTGAVSFGAQLYASTGFLPPMAQMPVKIIAAAGKTLGVVCNLHVTQSMVMTISVVA